LCCGENCNKNQPAVKCVLCALWAHKDCLRMPDTVYKSLDQQFRETGLAYWVCRPCQNFSQRVKHQFEESSKRQEETEKRVTENEKGISRHEKDIEDVRRTMRQLAERMDQEQERRDGMVCEEMQEREVRRRNLVLHGVPEAPESVRGSRERTEWDKDRCQELFLGMRARTRKEDLRFCRRVGERGTEPRPIVIGLFKEDDKEHILSKARELNGTMYQNVSIVPDLTKKQRSMEAKMKEEADSRNRNLSAEDMRNNLKWIVVGRRGEKRLIKGVERDREGFRRERTNTRWQAEEHNPYRGPRNMEQRMNTGWQTTMSGQTQNSWRGTQGGNSTQAVDRPILLPPVAQPTGRMEQRADNRNSTIPERAYTQQSSQNQQPQQYQQTRNWQPQSMEQQERRGGTRTSEGAGQWRMEHNNWNRNQDQENRRAGAQDRPMTNARDQEEDIWNNAGRNRLGSKRGRNTEAASEEEEEEETEPPTTRTRY